MSAPETPTPKMPDITKAQVLSVITAIAGLFLSQGYIDSKQEQFLVGMASIVVPIIITLADAMIRGSRAQMHGTIEAAKVTAAGGPAAAPATVVAPVAVEAPAVVPPPATEPFVDQLGR